MRGEDYSRSKNEQCRDNDFVQKRSGSRMFFLHTDDQQNSNPNKKRLLRTADNHQKRHYPQRHERYQGPCDRPSIGNRRHEMLKEHPRSK